MGITATADGALLRCQFQKLQGQATAQGLWLESTQPGAAGRLRLGATALGRDSSRARQCALTEPEVLALIAPTAVGGYTLAASGKVSVGDTLVRFDRPGLTEEYSVSVGGVRQDFVIAERPAGAGDLRVEMALSGARAEAASYGARLSFEGSGRALAYSRLRVEDATGRELAAHLEVLAANRLVVSVADADAAYPVRIDPTFSDADWVSLNPGLPGADGNVEAVAVDGSGNVYVGGHFSVIGAVAANGVAKWNGSAWSALGSGIGGYGSPPTVYALAVIGTNLYAGGDFTTAGGVTANYIAKWDGSTWSPLGSGMNHVVLALAASGNSLYAGGTFNNAGGVEARKIAVWDGSTWRALGSGMTGTDVPYQYVSALAVSSGGLYAGGIFTNAGGVAANSIAKWNGAAWSALGSGMSGAPNWCHVLALAVIGTNLYAGGNFTGAGGVPASGIARWDGAAWSALGSGLGSAPLGSFPEASALAVSGTTLYAGGNFTKAGGVTVNRVAKWDGIAWSGLDTGMNGAVGALAVSGSDLYAGGDFGTAGGVVAKGIAKWNSAAWSALGSGMDNTTYALAVSETNLYVGGAFTSAGGLIFNCVAKWNGSAWSALGSGMNTNIKALAVSGTNLYAGGYFTTAGGVTVNRIAKWDGSTWSALGSGMNSNVNALAVIGTNLYAGGAFTTAGGVTVNCIAKWDGSAWSALGIGMAGGYPSAYVSALAVSGTTLYAGGYFSTAGGVYTGGLAKWNGSSWSTVGSFYPYIIRHSAGPFLRH